MKSSLTLVITLSLTCNTKPIKLINFSDHHSFWYMKLSLTSVSSLFLVYEANKVLIDFSDPVIPGL